MLALGSFTEKYKDQNNIDVAIFGGVTGPFSTIGLPIALIISGLEFEFRLVPLSKEERWVVFHEKYPNLSRNDFSKKRGEK